MASRSTQGDAAVAEVWYPVQRIVQIKMNKLGCIQTLSDLLLLLHEGCVVSNQVATFCIQQESALMGNNMVFFSAMSRQENSLFENVFRDVLAMRRPTHKFVVSLTFHPSFRQPPIPYSIRNMMMIRSSMLS